MTLRCRAVGRQVRGLEGQVLSRPRGTAYVVWLLLVQALRSDVVDAKNPEQLEALAQELPEGRLPFLHPDRPVLCRGWREQWVQRSAYMYNGPNIVRVGSGLNLILTRLDKGEQKSSIRVFGGGIHLDGKLASFIVLIGSTELFFCDNARGIVSRSEHDLFLIFNLYSNVQICSAVETPSTSKLGSKGGSAKTPPVNDLNQLKMGPDL